MCKFVVCIYIDLRSADSAQFAYFHVSPQRCLAMALPLIFREIKIADDMGGKLNHWRGCAFISGTCFSLLTSPPDCNYFYVSKHTRVGNNCSAACAVNGRGKNVEEFNRFKITWLAFEGTWKSVRCGVSWGGSLNAWNVPIEWVHSWEFYLGLRWIIL